MSHMLDAADSIFVQLDVNRWYLWCEFTI